MAGLGPAVVSRSWSARSPCAQPSPPPNGAAGVGLDGGRDPAPASKRGGCSPSSAVTTCSRRSGRGLFAGDSGTVRHLHAGEAVRQAASERATTPGAGGGAPGVVGRTGLVGDQLVSGADGLSRGTSAHPPIDLRRNADGGAAVSTPGGWLTRSDLEPSGSEHPSRRCPYGRNPVRGDADGQGMARRRPERRASAWRRSKSLTVRFQSARPR